MQDFYVVADDKRNKQGTEMHGRLGTHGVAFSQPSRVNVFKANGIESSRASYGMAMSLVEPTGSSKKSSLHYPRRSMSPQLIRLLR